MRNKILCIAIILALMVAGIFLSAFSASASSLSKTRNAELATISEDYIPSEPAFNEEEAEPIKLENVVIVRVVPTTVEEGQEELDKAIFRRDLAVEIYQNLLLCGYAEEHPAVVMAKDDITTFESDIEYYEEAFAVLQEAHKWEVRMDEFPIATQAWLYMKNELGFNDVVCAGILGNLMAECGGSWYSDLDWDVSGSNGYGMIQWIGGRRNLLHSLYGSTPSVQDQLNYMYDELYGTNGVRPQVTESQLSAIMDAESPEDCAYAFASYFERCAYEYRSMRRGLARTAYEYYVG